MTSPQRYISTISDIKKLNERIVEVTLRHVQPEQLSFLPGQFITVMVGERTYRTYSICSDYKDISSLKIIAAVGHEGVGANYLKNAQVGQSVQFIGPSGLFRLNEPLSNEISMFATGTGIAPFIPMIIKLSDTAYRGKINLYFGIRNEKEIFYEQFLQSISSTLPFFDLKIHLSQPETPITKSHYKYGRITQVLAKELNPNGQYYICGHPEMVDEVRTGLILKQIPPENIISEKFTKSLK
jgi:ferredoxin-NADP reductase